MASTSDWLQLLRKIFLFSSFTGQQLNLIAKKMTMVSYPKGATLFKLNDPGDSLFLILTGTVQILKPGSDGDEILAYLNRGDVLGEMALLAGEPRPHTAVVDATAEVMVLHKKDFDALLESNPTMSLHLSRVLSTRLASVHRSGGVSAQPAKIFGMVLALPPDDQALFAVNLALSLVEQTRRKVLLVTINGDGLAPPISKHIGLESAKITNDHIRDRVLEDPRKFDKFVMIHPSGLELAELDVEVFNEQPENRLYPFFNLLKEQYDMCLFCLPPRVAMGTSSMLLENDRLLFVAGPQTNGTMLDELRSLEQFLSGTKCEKIWLSSKPGSQPNGYVSDFRFDWDPAWADMHHRKGTLFLGADAALGQRGLDRLARNLGHMVIGFAMGSGAAFGYALIGMLKVMEREGIHPDVISGTSMGALIGSFYASGISPTELEKIACSIDRKRLWQMADPIPPRTGIIRGNGVLEFLREHLGDRSFSELLLPFACVATDILTGKEIILDRGHVAQAVRASLSLPFFFQPYYLEGRYLVDGGLVNPVPTSIIVSQGANVLLSANLTSKAGERRVPRVIGWWRRHLPSMLKGPSIPETMLKTIYIMQHEIAQSRAELAHVVMQIKAHDLLWWDLDQAKGMIKMGEASAEEVLPKIKQLLPFFSDSCRVRLVRKGRKSY